MTKSKSSVSRKRFCRCACETSGEQRYQPTAANTTTQRDRHSSPIASRRSRKDKSHDAAATACASTSSFVNKMRRTRTAALHDGSPSNPRYHSRSAVRQNVSSARAITCLLWTVTLLVVLTVSMVPQSVTATHPRQCSGAIHHVHLSVGPEPSTSMIVSFASIPSQYLPPVAGILVGKSPSTMKTLYLEDDSVSPTSYNLTVPSKKLSTFETPQGKYMYMSPHYHHVTVSGLEPNTLYYYKPVIHAGISTFHARYPNIVSTAVANKKRLATNTLVSSDRNRQAEKKRDDGERRKLIERAHNPNHKGEDDDESINSSMDELKKRYQDDEDDTDIEDLDEDDEDEGAEANGGGSLRSVARQRRRLIKWGPYDGSKKQCPSPDKIRSFRTAPITVDTTKATPEPLNFAIMGDLGQFPHSEETMSRLMRDLSKVHLVVLAGDISYSGYDHRRWDTFFDFLDDYPTAEKVPLQIVPGNHDIDMAPKTRDMFLAYEYRFRMPRIKPPELELYHGTQLMKDGQMNMDAPPYPLNYEWGNAYYSFTYGMARFIMISSYSSMEPDSVQYNWILEELQSVDRTLTPWVIAVLHTPVYNTFSLHQRDPQILAAKKHLEPLFVEHKVNLVMTGHIHAYLRTVGVSMDVVDEKGPIHITVGAGGRKCEAPFKSATPEPWVAVRDATVFGYGMIHLFNSSVAEWDWIHTGVNEERRYNQLWQSQATLPPGPGTDRVIIHNQYFM